MNPLATVNEARAAMVEAEARFERCTLALRDASVAWQRASDALAQAVAARLAEMGRA